MLKAAHLLAVATLLPVPASAWGALGHRMVATAALPDLPAELAPWFAGQEGTLPDHANDPDHWKRQDPLEGPRHYLNCELYGGADQVPIPEDAARARLGPDLFKQAGEVPWTIQARVQELTAAFTSLDRDQVALKAAILCHYVGDINVPLHTTTNHDGDETGQHGIHSRWETGLLERLEEQEGWVPDVRPAVLSPGSATAPWSWLRQSFALVPGVLADDLTSDQKGARPAEAGMTRAYWDTFMQLQEPHVKEQINLSAQRTAEMIILAWTAAGSPANPSNTVHRPVQASR